MSVPPNKLRIPSGTDANEIRFKTFGAGVKQYSNYGPTSSTGYWNGITPPTGGYTIYAKKSSQGPAIFTAGNDQDLIYFTRLLGGSGITDDASALDYIRTINDIVCVNVDYPDIVTDGLVFCTDPGFTVCFPRTGSKCYDLSHSQILTEFSGAPRFGYGFGGFINFDGVSHLTSEPPSVSSISIGAWVRTEDPSANGYIVAKSDTTGAIPWVLSIGGGTQSPGSDGMSIYDGSTWKSSGITTDVRDGAWHYVMGTYDGIDRMKYYVDGFLDSSSGSGNGALSSTANKFFIGLLNFTSEYFAGDIGMVHIYNRALLPDEVLHNYTNTNPRFIAYNYVPGVLNWADISYDKSGPSYTYTTQRVTGIDTNIYLKPEYSGGDANLFYDINPSLVTFNGSLSPSSQGFTQVDSLVNFTVPGGSYVTFGCEGITGPNSFEVSIYNSSDGGALLDQFTVTIL